MDVKSLPFRFESAAVKTAALRWAPMSSVIGEKRMKNRLEIWKYRVRYFLSSESRTKFISRISNHDFGRAVFESNPTNYYVPLRSYLDNRFTVKERFDACFVDVETARTKFGDLHANSLILGRSITVMQFGKFNVDLQMNRVSQHEGFWALSIKDEFGKPVSNLSFGFLDSQTILIASIQGIKDSSRNMLDLNKQVTKAALGLRPQNVSVVVLQALCNAWGIKNLIGIDPRNQVKRKINTERQGFKFDYVRFWTEIKAVKNFISGYWIMSIMLPVRDLTGVPSHKRNQYRKRNELLEDLNSSSKLLFRK